MGNPDQTIDPAGDSVSGYCIGAKAANKIRDHKDAN